VSGSNGKLYDNHWNGVQWGWEDPGAPPNATVTSDPAAVAFSAVPGMVYAFVRGSNGHLYDTFPASGQWRWEDLGTPPTTSAAGQPAAVWYGAGDINEVSSFVRGANGRFYAVHGGAGHWTWIDLGQPPTASVIGDPGASAYFYQFLRVYIFAQGSDGHLYVNRWDGGAQSTWADKGVPPHVTVVGRPGVISSRFQGFTRLYAFVRGSDGHLYVNFWDGAQWNWADQGVPPATTIGGDPGMVGYSGVYGPEGLYAFIRGSNGHLYVDYWNGARWTWADQGVPANATIGGDPGVVTSPFSRSTAAVCFCHGQWRAFARRFLGHHAMAVGRSGNTLLVGPGMTFWPISGGANP
jgi:hypothetical protein